MSNLFLGLICFMGCILGFFAATAYIIMGEYFHALALLILVLYNGYSSNSCLINFADEIKASRSS